VVSFLGQYYSAQDLQQFQKLYGTPVLPIEHTFGPNDPTAPGVEASLDVQYLTGVTGAGRGSFGAPPSHTTRTTHNTHYTQHALPSRI
jgi:tripeptidyl-peptidase-1